MEQPAKHSTMRRDLLSAYLAAGSRIASWAGVSALLYRYAGADAFAMVALVRGTIGILNYTSVGLAPALIHLMAEAKERVRSALVERAPEGDTPAGPRVLSYAAPPALAADPVQSAYANGLAMAIGCGALGLLVCAAGFFAFPFLVRIPASMDTKDVTALVLLMGVGTVLRLAGDTGGAILQAHGRITRDNALIAIGETLWLAITVAGAAYGGDLVKAVGGGYLVSGLASAMLRDGSAHALAAPLHARSWWWCRLVRRELVGRLLSFGALVMLAQLADYLYAPTAYLLINRLLEPVDLAAYAPVVQIDAGLLILVSGLAAVLLPRSALAHAAGDRDRVRQYYVRGTLASLGLLVLAAGGVWALAPWIFWAWLHDPMPATQAILPLVLIHTVVGGSSAVGRSILLGMGKVKPFTVAVLTAGVCNVLLSFCFVYYLHLGLRGIVLGTIIAVVGRCAIWMPWYVMKTIRQGPLAVTAPQEAEEPMLDPTQPSQVT